MGQKQPNAFGLHDMHGNVMEWCIDSYTEDGYTSLADKPQPLSLSDAIIWPETFDNRVVRGGSWQDDAEQLRLRRTTRLCRRRLESQRSQLSTQPLVVHRRSCSRCRLPHRPFLPAARRRADH
ncbi:MAG: SUMF1/EgtB/PvdO family nonheme iron enzyme [Pirellulaceae bacterium]